MGASVSLPGPFAQFSRLTLSDVDEMIIRHRTQLDGAFMVTPQELEAIVGPKVKDAAAIIAQLEAGEEGKINALSFLCGAVAVSPPAPGGGDAGRRQGQRGACSRSSTSAARAADAVGLGILLLSLGRALERSWACAAASRVAFGRPRSTTPRASPSASDGA